MIFVLVLSLVQYFKPIRSDDEKYYSLSSVADPGWQCQWLFCVYFFLNHDYCIAGFIMQFLKSFFFLTLAQVALRTNSHINILKNWAMHAQFNCLHTYTYHLCA